MGIKIARIMRWKTVGVLEGDTTSFRADETDIGGLEKFKSLLRSDKGHGEVWIQTIFYRRRAKLRTKAVSRRVCVYS